jgi:hypothetical protein
MLTLSDIKEIIKDSRRNRYDIIQRYRDEVEMGFDGSFEDMLNDMAESDLESKFSGLATGGRVGLQEGGLGNINLDGVQVTPQNYEDILANIQASYPTDAQQTMTRPGPQGEALQSIFGPVLAQFLGRPISPTGGTNVFGQQFGSFIPQQQAQNVLQQQQIQQALNQAGLGTAQFDPTTGGLTGVTGTGTGVAGFQPFLDAATTITKCSSTS